MIEILLIGYGAMAKKVFAHLAEDARLRISAVLVLPEKVADSRAILPESVAVVTRPEDLSEPPDLVVECAAHAAVRAYAERFLLQGIDVLIISSGALSDSALLDRLQRAAEAGGARLIVPAGAVAGTDGITAAMIGELKSLRYTSRKPPLAWRGTPAEEVVDLATVRDEVVVFEGSASKAARLYPKNANVAATIALRGPGLEATEVRLIADPHVQSNIHQVHVSGSFGALEIKVEGRPLEENPKTSALAALSVVAEVLEYAELKLLQ